MSNARATTARALLLVAVAMFSGLAVGVLATASPASAAALQNIAGTNAFDAVACPTSTQCVGIAQSFNLGALAAPLDPATGEVSTGESVQTLSNIQLSSVACTAPTSCVAVGTNSNGNLGAAVTINPTTGAATGAVHYFAGTGSLTDVSCDSSAQCLGVGVNPGGTGGVVVPLDPTTGQLATGQSVQAIALVEDFSGVTCQSISNCLSVGSDFSGDAISVLLNPTTGAIAAEVQIVPGIEYFEGVACNSTSQCLAVGLVQNISAEQGSITGWAVPLNPTTGEIATGQKVQQIDVLPNSVACLSTSTCLALGASASGAQEAGATELLNPVTGQPAIGASVQNISGAGPLLGAACASADGCLGVGSNANQSSGEVVPLDPTTGVVPVVPGPYSPMTPVRICDTRPGNPSMLNSAPANQCNGVANAGSTIAAHGTLNLNVAGSFGIPADATAVILNVTVVGPLAAGYATVFPTGTTQPVASNINYRPGQTVPNLVEVGTGSAGGVSIYSSAQANVVVDVEGYVDTTASGGPGAGLYVPLSTPVRICDTRPKNPSTLSAPNIQCNGSGNAGETLPPNGSLNVQVAGVARLDGIPAGATAAVFNVTVTNPAQAGYLTVFPEGSSQPGASNVNYQAGQTKSNRVVVPLSVGGAKPGQITIFSSASADVIVDVSGYYTAANGTGAQFSAEVAPVRICDTRLANPSLLSGPAAQCNGPSDSGMPIGPGQTLNVHVAGLAGIPASGATAVVVNVTGVQPTASTYLTVFPNTLPSPAVSDLNLVSGQNTANLVVATMSSTGTISIYNHNGTTNVVVDVLGWYS